MAEQRNKCANEPCHCLAPLGQAFCSDYCRHAATSGPPRREKVCECEHEPCRGHA